MVELVELQALAYVAQIVGVIGTLTAAFIAVRSYINVNKRSEEAKKKEQEAREIELETQKQNLETRQAQLFMQSFNLWITYMMDKYLELITQKWSTYEEWKEKYHWKTNTKGFMVYGAMDTFFEGIGVLVKRKLIDPWLVDEFMSADIINYWDRMRPIAEGIRKEKGWELWGENSEYLYNEVLKVYRQQHPDLVSSSQ